MSSGDFTNLKNAGYSGALGDMRKQWLTDNEVKSLQELLIARGFTGGVSDMLRQQAQAAGYPLNEFSRLFGHWYADGFLVTGTTRSILNFNGTQYATLSEPVVLDGDFEIEVVLLGTALTDRTQTAVSGSVSSDPWFYINGASQGGNMAVRYNDGGDNQYLSNPKDVRDGKIHNVVLSRENGVGTLKVDEVVTDRVMAQSLVVDNLCINSSATDNEYFGSIFSIRIWKNGDRNTGELVTDLRFDESDTNYQRNYAVALGVNLADSEPSTIRETWTDNGDGSFTAVSNGKYLAMAWSGVVAGKVYKISYDIVHHGDGGIRVINGAVSEPWDVSTVDGHREVSVTADSTSLGFRHDNDAHFTISNISIREWSGAILENTLPGDWEEISKKSEDDFWLGVENLIEGEAPTYFIKQEESQIDYEGVEGRHLIKSASEDPDVTGINYGGIFDIGKSYRGTYVIERNDAERMGVSDYPHLNVPLNTVGTISYDIVAERTGLYFKRLNNPVDVVLRVQPVHRLLEYADGALVEPEEPVDPPIGTFGTDPMESDTVMTNTLASLTGGEEATIIETTPVSTMIELVGGNDSVVSMRSTVVSEDPVYFEYDVEGDAEIPDVAKIYSPVINLDGDNFINTIIGGLPTVNAGQTLEYAFGDAGVAATRFENPVVIDTYAFASGETTASAGPLRFGIAYTPATGTYFIHMWSLNGASFQYPTALDVSPVAVFGPYTLNPQEVANHFSVTVVLAIPSFGATVGVLTLKLLTNAADFNRPGGMPAGYQDLETVTGGDTSTFTIPLQTTNPSA